MQPEYNQQQYTSVPTEPSFKPKKGGFNWKKVLLFVLVAILAAALSGASVWGYMSKENNSNSNSLNAQITTKNKEISVQQTQVTALQKAIAAKTTTTSTSTQQTSSTDLYKSLLSFCSNGGYTVQQVTLTNQDTGSSYFANCAVSKGAASGYQITAKYINVESTWAQLYSGQGPAASSVCTQNDIPTILGVCA
jgi:hypothetical protein